MEELNTTPRVCFSKFDNSWHVAFLPELSISVIDGDRGQNYPSGTDFSNVGHCLFLNAKNVTKDGFSFSEVSFISEDKDETLRKGKLTRNDIVVTTRGTVGNIAHYDESVPYENIRINSGMVLLRNLGRHVDSLYLKVYLASPKVQQKISSIAFGSAQPQLTVKEILRLEICYPSLQEQRNIASFLTAINYKIQQLSKKKALLEQYKKGVMQRIFSQEIRFKDDNGNSYPNWNVKKLGEIGMTYNGLTGKTKENFGVGAYYVTYKQIFDKSSIDPERFERVEVIDNERQNQAKYGDIFFTTSSETPNEVGYSSVLLCEVESLYLNSFCFGYRVDCFNTLSPNFARYLFRSPLFRRKVVKLAQGSTRYNMSKLEFLKLTVDLPVHQEQCKIANFLVAVDDKINHVDRQLELTKQYKKGLLQQMFV